MGDIHLRFAEGHGRRDIIYVAAGLERRVRVLVVPIAVTG
jgi:hypothetical protein